MKKWHKLIAALAVVGFFGVLSQTAPASADNSEATSSTKSISKAEKTSSNEQENTNENDSNITNVTFGQTKEVKVGDTVIWHSVFTPGNTVKASAMKDLSFSDPLNSKLEYVDAKVYQVKKVDSSGNPVVFGKDITAAGNLSYAKATNTVTWIPKEPSNFIYSAGNPNSTIDLMITTKVKESNREEATIPNTASMTLDGKRYQTETPKVHIKTTPLNKVTKVIAKSPLGKLAKTGVELGQNHPIIAALLAVAMIIGFGSWGYHFLNQRRH